jgi:hypothetical protein
VAADALGRFERHALAGPQPGAKLAVVYGVSSERRLGNSAATAVAHYFMKQCIDSLRCHAAPHRRLKHRLLQYGSPVRLVFQKVGNCPKLNYK